MSSLAEVRAGVPTDVAVDEAALLQAWAALAAGFSSANSWRRSKQAALDPPLYE